MGVCEVVRTLLENVATDLENAEEGEGGYPKGADTSGLLHDPSQKTTPGTPYGPPPFVLSLALSRAVESAHKEQWEAFMCASNDVLERAAKFGEINEHWEVVKVLFFLRVEAHFAHAWTTATERPFGLLELRWSLGRLWNMRLPPFTFQRAAEMLLTPSPGVSQPKMALSLSKLFRTVVTPLKRTCIAPWKEGGVEGRTHFEKIIALFVSVIHREKTVTVRNINASRASEPLQPISLDGGSSTCTLPVAATTGHRPAGTHTPPTRSRRTRCPKCPPRRARRPFNWQLMQWWTWHT